MNDGALKLIRRYVKTLATPEARNAAAATLLPAWRDADHKTRGKLRAKMQARLDRVADATVR
jgi:hypothetical protein